MIISVQVQQTVRAVARLNGVVIQTIGGETDMTELRRSVLGDQDGVNKTFRTPDPYVAGTLIVVLDGVEYTVLSGDIVETDPDTGTFTWVGDAPTADQGHWTHYKRQ